MELQTELKTNNEAAEQLKLLKRMHTLSVIRTAACVLMLAVLLVSALYVLPKVDGLMERLTAAADQLEQVDVARMAQSVTDMALTGTEGIETALKEVQAAMEKIDKLDIDALNKSIEDLGAVMEPLARLFGKR